MESHPILMDCGSLTGRTILECKTIHIRDVLKGPEYKLTETAKVGRYRTLLGVPLMREATPIGVISLQRNTVRPFTDKQVELVSNFARQAVIAIENTRLLNELRESLLQQTATSEVLQVISSSPGDLDPVFDALLENATQICEANFGNLVLAEGDAFRFVAQRNAPQAYADAIQRSPVLRPPPGHTFARVAKSKQEV